MDGDLTRIIRGHHDRDCSETSVSGILLGKGEQPVHLLAKYGNRHGLVAGATGTGKTVSLLVLAEGFSRLGVPVFMADVKGDVAGLAMPGAASDKIRSSASAQIGIEGYAHEASPVVFWDLYGKAGHPGPHHRQRDRPDPARPHSRAERHAGGRARRSPSSWPTTRACCCSISTICARC